MNDDPRYDKPDGAQLLQAFRAGDVQAAALLYRRHLRTIRNRIRTIIYDKATVEDLVQDVFLSAFRDKELPTNLVAYLKEIARNKALDKLRKLKVIKRAMSALEEEVQHVSTAANANSRLNADSCLADRGDVERIATGLAPNKLNLLKMAADEIPHAEIGNERGSSEKAATVAIHAVRDQAQGLMHPDDAYGDYELLIRVANDVPTSDIANALNIPESAIQRRIKEARKRAKTNNKVLLWMEAEKVPHSKIAEVLDIPESAVQRRIDQAQNRGKVKSGQGDGPSKSFGAKNKGEE